MTDRLQRFELKIFVCVLLKKQSHLHLGCLYLLFVVLLYFFHWIRIIYGGFISLLFQEGVKTSDHINLKVAGQDGSVVQFKIKRYTPLNKLMKAYCERQVSAFIGKLCIFVQCAHVKRANLILKLTHKHAHQPNHFI
uniref:Rad60/SUMO-like domain-containing protein n=1 Tax=Sinocyclocheilus rhinocerous TaxID=307959 RepID=A0A673G934_9TELE